MKNNTSQKDNRRYKYGSLSAVFTVVFIALILVINLVFSSLSISGDLTVDLTQEDFTSISEDSITLLSELGKNLDIKLYFMSARDKFDLDSNNYNGINLTAISRDLAENYAKAFDGSGDLGTVTVEYKELDKDPEFEKQYLEGSTKKLSATSVIVKGKHHYRVLDLASFFTLDEEGKYHSFNGEYALTTAMLQSSIAEPQVVTLTYGHGEPIGADGLISQSSSVAGLVSILSGAGFEIKTANLLEEAIDPRTEILICYDPVSDFSYDEIDDITEYLGRRKSFLVFVDSATPSLPKLQSCLEDNWGLNYKPFYRVTDDTHSLGNRADNINAAYPEMDSETAQNSAAYQIYKTAVDAEGAMMTALPESVELAIRDGLTQDDFLVESVLLTHDTAKSATPTESGSEGAMPLALLSTKQYYGENNAVEYAYVMLVGSTEFASTENLAKQSFGNNRIILSAARIFSSKRVAPEIDDKPFGSTALTIETGTAKTLSWLICTIVPGIVMIFGFVVFFKRRHL